MELVGYTRTRGRRLIFCSLPAAASTDLPTRSPIAPAACPGCCPQRACGRRRVCRPRGRQSNSSHVRPEYYEFLAVTRAPWSLL